MKSWKTGSLLPSGGSVASLPSSSVKTSSSVAQGRRLALYGELFRCRALKHRHGLVAEEVARSDAATLLAGSWRGACVGAPRQGLSD